ncbi:MAG: hypothetical protein PUD55_00515 [Firmicutes bacterium]|nr:hypothetical protein [Bacillota bacterium]
MKRKLLLVLITCMALLVLCGCMSTNAPDVDPDQVKISVTGIDDDDFFAPMGLDSIDIMEDGQAILHATGKLLDRVGENYVAAMGVSEVYVLPYGNGGYRCVVFLMQDGTVSALSPTKMIEKNAAQLKTNLGKLENIVKVEPYSDEDGNCILVYDKDGKEILLDEYLDF